MGILLAIIGAVAVGGLATGTVGTIMSADAKRGVNRVQSQVSEHSNRLSDLEGRVSNVEFGMVGMAKETINGFQPDSVMAICQRYQNGGGQ